MYRCDPEISRVGASSGPTSENRNSASRPLARDRTLTQNSGSGPGPAKLPSMWYPQLPGYSSDGNRTGTTPPTSPRRVHLPRPISSPYAAPSAAVSPAPVHVPPPPHATLSPDLAQLPRPALS